MYTVITRFTRPTPHIPYYLELQSNAELKQKFNKFQDDYAFFFQGYTKEDNSETVQTTSVSFEDETIFNVFMEWFTEQFPTFFADRDAYCAANNIVIERSVSQT